jgi:aminoglycoside 2'-N-acetyltransferase I
MTIESFPEAEVPPGLRLQVLALQRQAWPREGPLRLCATHDPALQPVSLLLVEDGRVLAALDVLSKRIAHRGQEYAASGLSTVVTDAALRRRGYGRTLVEAGREAIEASGADVGLFTCDRPLQAFYQAAGWQLLPGTVLVGGTAPSRSRATGSTR